MPGDQLREALVATFGVPPPRMGPPRVGRELNHGSIMLHAFCLGTPRSPHLKPPIEAWCGRDVVAVNPLHRLLSAAAPEVSGCPVDGPAAVLGPGVGLGGARAWAVAGRCVPVGVGPWPGLIERVFNVVGDGLVLPGPRRNSLRRVRILGRFGAGTASFDRPLLELLGASGMSRWMLPFGEPAMRVCSFQAATAFRIWRACDCANPTLYS